MNAKAGGSFTIVQEKMHIDFMTYKYCLDKLSYGMRHGWVVILYLNDLKESALIQILTHINKKNIKDRISELRLVDDIVYKNDKKNRGVHVSDINTLMTSDVLEQIEDYLMDNVHLRTLWIIGDGMEPWMHDVLSCLPGNTKLHTLRLKLDKSIQVDDIVFVGSIIRQTYITEFTHLGNIFGSLAIDIREVCRIPFDERELPLKSKTKSAAKIS